MAEQSDASQTSSGVGGANGGTSLPQSKTTEAPKATNGSGHPVDPTIITDFPKVGEKDRSGLTIKDIYYRTRRFVLYACGSEVHYELAEDYATAEKLRKSIFGLIELRSSIERLRANKVLPL